MDINLGKTFFRKNLKDSFGGKDTIKKAGFSDGTIREWNGKKYKKISGKWFPIGKNSSPQGKEKIKNSSKDSFKERSKEPSKKISTPKSKFQHSPKEGYVGVTQKQIEGQKKSEQNLNNLLNESLSITLSKGGSIGDWVKKTNKESFIEKEKLVKIILGFTKADFSKNKTIENNVLELNDLKENLNLSKTLTPKIKVTIDNLILLLQQI